jgi:hypothetical protein
MPPVKTVKQGVDRVLTNPAQMSNNNYKKNTAKIQKTTDSIGRLRGGTPKFHYQQIWLRNCSFLRSFFYIYFFLFKAFELKLISLQICMTSRKIYFSFSFSQFKVFFLFF